MKTSIRYAPVNSIFFFEDSQGGEAPAIDDREIRIWASDTSVIVGCLMWQDGETDLTVSTSFNDAPSGNPQYECELATPSKMLSVVTSGNEVLMQVEVPRMATRMQVWTNHISEPDKIFVLISE